jgi:hypothetical protein
VRSRARSIKDGFVVGLIAPCSKLVPVPIPSFDANGFLPQGLHDCSLDEIKRRFGSFQKSEQRPQLFERLQRFVQEARVTGLIRSIIIDGSFVTAAPRPNDIDLILVLSSDQPLDVDFSPDQYNVLSKRKVRLRHGFDLLVARENSDELSRYLQFFQQIRFEPGRRKGILRLNL